MLFSSIMSDKSSNYMSGKSSKYMSDKSKKYMSDKSIKSNTPDVPSKSSQSDLIKPNVPDESKISNITIPSDLSRISVLTFTDMPLIKSPKPSSKDKSSDDNKDEDTSSESPSENEEDLDFGFDSEIDGILEAPDYSWVDHRNELPVKEQYVFTDQKRSKTSYKKLDKLRQKKMRKLYDKQIKEAGKMKKSMHECGKKKNSTENAAATELETEEAPRKPREKKELSYTISPTLTREVNISDEELKPNDKIESVYERLSRKTEVYIPEQVGIIEILMKRRREKWEEDKAMICTSLPPDDKLHRLSGSASVISEEGVAVPSEESEGRLVRRRKPIYIECKFIKPGPGHYEVNPTIGFEGHDPTRKRAPRFSFGYRRDLQKKGTVPGPIYNTRDFTIRGKVKTKALKFGKKRPDPVNEETPGPGHYEDQSLNVAKRICSIKIYGKPVEKITETPFAIGELSYMGNGRPAALLIGKPKEPKDRHFPSPLTYPAVNADVFLTKSPAYTMGVKRKLPMPDFTPPIGCYNPNYDYFKKKCDIAIPRNNDECVGVPVDFIYLKTKRLAQNMYK